jgi:hypothetical protein
LLALIAAGALCVLGAAAAGYTISFPILDAFIDAISVSPEERAARDAQSDWWNSFAGLFVRIEANG